MQFTALCIPSVFGQRVLTKTMRIMKLTAIILLSACLTANAKSVAQISISESNVPLPEIFKQIEKQSGYVFLYNYELLQQAGKVSVKIKNVSLQTALNECLRGKALTYEIIDKTIIIRPKKEMPELAPAKPEVVAEIVKGKVTDEEGKPIAGVSVVKKGGAAGTATDKEGNFLIDAAKGDILVFSSVGYATREVKVREGFLNISLQIAVSPLDQVLVGANLVATKRKADVTSTTVLTANDLKKIPGNNLTGIFTGIVPGTFVPELGQSAVENDFDNVAYIRGAANFLTGSSPLKVYVDGVQFAAGTSMLGIIDKNSVEKIEIVRGANATALYGSDASGGIILITTKKSLRNSTSINLSTATGFINTKWVANKANQQDHTISISQGIGKFRYLVGGSYRKIGAILPEGGENTGSIYSTATVELLSNLKVDFNARYTQANTSQQRNPAFDGITDTIFRQVNKESLFDSLYTEGINTNYNIGATITYKATSWWSHSLVVGIDKIKQQYGTKYGVPDSYTSSHMTYSLTSTNNRPTYRYNNTITVGDSHNWSLNILSGFEFSKQTGAFGEISSQPDLFGNPGSFIVSNTQTESPELNNQGYFLQTALAIKEKYFFTAAYRIEKSDQFNGSNGSPKLGFTTNFTTRQLIIKPRISWGIGITLPPYDALNPQSVNNIPGVINFLANPNIKPQQQKGFDYGVELYSKKGDYKFEAAYFNNKLVNAINFDIITNPPNDPYPESFEYFNVGKSHNSGIELSGQYNKKGFSISGNYSIVNSIIDEDVNTAGTTYKKGDRFKSIPKNTFGANIGYTFNKLFGKQDPLTLSFGIAGISGGIITNTYQFRQDVATWIGGGMQGPRPQQQTIDMPTVIRASLNLEYNPVKTFSIFIAGKNIFNNYTAELGKQKALPGSNFLFGMRYNFQQ